VILELDANAVLPQFPGPGSVSKPEADFRGRVISILRTLVT